MSVIWAAGLGVAVWLLVSGLVSLFGWNETVDVEPASLSVSGGEDDTTGSTNHASDPIEVPAETVMAGEWTAQSVPGEWPVATAVGRVADRFVLACWTYGSDVSGRGKLWMSPNGWKWTELARDLTIYEGGHGAEHVVGDDGGGVAWGPNLEQGGTVLWQSDDGSLWRKISAGDGPFETDIPSGGVALRSGGYVLYGVDDRCLALANCGKQARRVLVSTDGVNWELVQAEVTFSAMIQHEESLVAVAAPPDPVILWTSTDMGYTWERVEGNQSSGFPSAETVNTMTSTPFGLVAGGTDSSGSPALWVSGDGQAFRTAWEGSSTSQTARITATASGAGWVVAVGSEGSLPLMVATSDGTEWSRVSLDGLFSGASFLEDIAYHEGTFVAIGNQADGEVPLVLRWEDRP